MEIIEAIEALGALGQESRLRVFRLLVRAGPEGVPAGEIAEQLRVPANRMSSHLAVLSRGRIGVVAQARPVGDLCRDLKGTRKLLAFLVEDCCQGKPEVCRPLLACLRECC